MKSILLSIRSEWVCKILNGEKTIEVRKKFPKDYVGWVYIYCTKDRKHADLINRGGFLTGMVVARFYCDRVEEITCRKCWGEWESYTETLGFSEISQASCLKNREIVHYLKGKNGYAIHISKLEVFDKPKELSEFYKPCKYKNIKCKDYCLKHKQYGVCEVAEDITKPPQNYCYVEEKELENAK